MDNKNKGNNLVFRRTLCNEISPIIAVLFTLIALFASAYKSSTVMRCLPFLIPILGGFLIFSFVIYLRKDRFELSNLGIKHFEMMQFSFISERFLKWSDIEQVKLSKINLGFKQEIVIYGKGNKIWRPAMFIWENTMSIPVYIFESKEFKAALNEKAPAGSPLRNFHY
jgi:hypothetical protein